MKISYRDYPILEKLQKGKFGQMTTGILDAEYFYSAEWGVLYKIWKENTKYFLKEINVLSEPFMEACGKVGFLYCKWHFRLQPYRQELKNHKIIWISEYTKSGYTAPA